MAGEEHDGNRLPAVAQKSLDLETVDLGHRHVKHETGGTPTAFAREELLRIGEARDPETQGTEQPCQGRDHLLLVVEHVDDRGGGHGAAPFIGNETLVVVPRPGDDSIETRPP